jgi:hypothetical protein
MNRDLLPHADYSHALRPAGRAERPRGRSGRDLTRQARRAEASPHNLRPRRGPSGRGPRQQTHHLPLAVTPTRRRGGKPGVSSKGVNR